jgi:type IV pili sensor histidine kinase/response regulator
MTPSSFLPKRPLVAVTICFAGFSAVASANLQANVVQTGRYSVLTATPTEAQVELLATTVMIRFPQRIQTVGEAVHHLLQRSGYRLVPAAFIDPETAALLALPLPAVHRSLGPMTLRDALTTLAGPAFRLVQDPVHRLMTFERCGSQRVAAPAIDTHRAKEGAADEE